jgi:hypothetical protein
MGQRHLPKELRTRKINSLPEDLKGIAEELIAVKFDIREEIVTKKRSRPFRQEYPSGYGIEVSADGDIRMGALGEPFMGRFRGDSPGVEVSHDFATRERIYRTPIAEPTFRGIRDALYRLDEANAPRRDVKAFIGSRGFLDYLRSDRDIGQHIAYSDRHRGKREYLGDIFGVSFFVVEGVPTEIIAK